MPGARAAVGQKQLTSSKVPHTTKKTTKAAAQHFEFQIQIRQVSMGKIVETDETEEGKEGTTSLGPRCACDLPLFHGTCRN